MTIEITFEEQACNLVDWDSPDWADQLETVRNADRLDQAMREAASDEEWEQGSRFCGSVRNRQMRDSHFATA